MYGHARMGACARVRGCGMRLLAQVCCVELATGAPVVMVVCRFLQVWVHHQAHDVLIAPPSIPPTAGDGVLCGEPAAAAEGADRAGEGRGGKGRHQARAACAQLLSCGHSTGPVGTAANGTMCVQPVVSCDGCLVSAGPVCWPLLLCFFARIWDTGLRLALPWTLEGACTLHIRP